MLVDYLAGKRKQGLVVNLAAAGAVNAQAIFAQSVFAGMQGAKTLVIKRLKIRSNAVGADTWVHVGTGGGGAAFVEAIPPLRLINNTTIDFAENDLPQTELNANITAYPDAVGGGSVDIQVEVEERG